MIINGREVVVHFVGRFNAYNLLAVYGAAVSLGKDPEETLIVLSTLHSVSGRFETIQSPKGYTAIVDYAHTPDALTNVLNGIDEVLNGRGRIITVVGAGGNRDKGKRPLMAKEAAKLSDQVILTSDNPRFEEPDDIINDMVAGLSKADMERTLCITDRMQAIKTAAMLAKKGDIEEHMMYNTYNMGIGMVVAVDAADAERTMKAMKSAGDTPYIIGSIEAGEKGVTLC